MNKHLSLPGAAPPPARKIRVVVVDDSAPALTSLTHLLRKFLPLQVAGQAENGLEGVALAARLQPDLVITDLQMPGLDGLQLVALLRQKHPAIRSIITSVHDGPTLQAASLGHGADAFVTKQRLPDELPHLLGRLFPDAAAPANPKGKA